MDIERFEEIDDDRDTSHQHHTDAKSALAYKDVDDDDGDSKEVKHLGHHHHGASGSHSSLAAAANAQAQAAASRVRPVSSVGALVSSTSNGIAGGSNMSSGTGAGPVVDARHRYDDELKLSNAPVVAVPRLDDLIIKALAEHYDVHPAFDRIPPEYLDNVVALLDPSQIDFVVAARYITTEKFWKRLCRERWPVCDLSGHGQSYKRLYVERHLTVLLENYHPSKDDQNYVRLMKQVSAASAFVHTVKVQQLLSHLDMCRILAEFQSLTTLEIKYGARKLGMDYDKALFGMQSSDALSLAKLFSRHKTLSRVVLSENLLSDDIVSTLVAGLVRNVTITHLDLSHNKISDAGAKKLCQLLESHGVLTCLNLGDNFIHKDGARDIAAALANNSVLASLSLRLNPLGDDGGARILRDGLLRNSSVTSLDLSSCGLDVTSGEALSQLLEVNTTLTTIDVSCNEVAINGGRDILRALQNRPNITSLDIRKNAIADDVARDLKVLLTGRSHELRDTRLKAFQTGGWDDAL